MIHFFICINCRRIADVDEMCLWSPKQFRRGGLKDDDIGVDVTLKRMKFWTESKVGICSNCFLVTYVDIDSDTMWL